MNVIIVHGGPLTKIPENPHNLDKLYWQPWVKNELERRGIKCDIPAMPNPWFPIYEDWRNTFEKLDINEDTVLVGHSRGVAFLVRWLGDTGRCYKKLIMVAPNLRSESADPVVNEFYNYTLDSKISSCASERIVFTSENDDLENIESARILRVELDCSVINLPRHGHYITQDMGSNEFPELVDSILDIK